MGNFSLNKVNKETGEITGTMNVEVRAYPVAEPKGNVKGYASITIDDMFAVSGISIVEGKNGLFISMPQIKDSKGTYRDLAHPVTKEGREALNVAVLNAYDVALDGLIAQKESTLDKIRDGKKAVAERTSLNKEITKNSKTHDTI